MTSLLWSAVPLASPVLNWHSYLILHACVQNQVSTVWLYNQLKSEQQEAMCGGVQCLVSDSCSLLANRAGERKGAMARRARRCTFCPPSPVGDECRHVLKFQIWLPSF